MSTVACPACGTICPAGQKFCGECATPLPRVCPACGALATATQKFCGECATPLGFAPAPAATTTVAPEAAPHLATAPATSTSPSLPAPGSQSTPVPQEERRLVTALFCDLVGFTPLSESLDPEQVRDIQAEYFSAMSEQIERYGGTVEKYAGDAVLALFGAPVAHEDDAERAVLCALGMQRAIEPVAATAHARWGVDPQIRIGVNTGEVVSGAWDVSGRQDVAVTGDALNTAGRLQATAEPGEILVGSETMRLTRRRIRYGERRDVTLKGKAAPVSVWPALGIREEFGERWEGYETPLVGRDREMMMLIDAWVRAQAGEGQLVSIIGDPGVGKSRLVAEFLGTLTSPSAVRVVRARSLSYGQEISLWLVADLLRSLFGIKEQETPDDIAVRLRGTIPVLFGHAETGAEALDVMGEVLGLPIGESAVSRAGPQARRQALMRSLRTVLGAMTERAPTVVVLEDLHWIDNASKDILTEVLAGSFGLRMLVLAAQRPGWIPPWSEWGWPERVTLRPLAEDDAATLAGAVLGGLPLGPDLERHVAERAAGNPFFLEEMLRSLQETGALEERNGRVSLVQGAVERLPSSLTEVLLARLDRLEGETKQVVQVASVIGRSFAVQLLSEVVGQAATLLEQPLSQLQRAEIAFPRRSPDLEYVFKHVSMRDAAYNTLVQRRRQELHLQTARAIASLYPSDEYAEMIAYHYARTDAPEAAEWLERAGDRAAAVYANEEAIEHYEETIRRLERQDAEPRLLARLEEKIGLVLYTAARYDEALEHLGRAVEMARDQHDLETAGRVTALMGMAHRYRGTPAEGIPLVAPMIDLLAWLEPSAALGALYNALASLSYLVGRYRDAMGASERAGEIARAIGDDRLLGEAEGRRASALNTLGHPEEALAIFERAIPLIEAGGDLLFLSVALNNMGVACDRLGRVEENRSYMERALAVAERMGSPDQIVFVLGNLGDCLLTLGDWATARAASERALALMGERRTANSGTVLQQLGQLALYEGDWPEAERLLNETLAIALRTGERQRQEYPQSLLAELDILAGRPENAVSRLEGLVAAEDVDYLVPVALSWALLETGAVDRAAGVIEPVVRTAREKGERAVLLLGLRVQGMVLRRQGRDEDARGVFEEGLELARSFPFPYVEARILEQMGRPEEALTIFRRLGAKKDVERLEHALAP